MKTKSIIFLACLAIFYGNTTNAQQKGTSEISASSGLLTSNQIVDSFSGLFTYPVSLGTAPFEDEKYSGSYALSYKYHRALYVFVF